MNRVSTYSLKELIFVRLVESLKMTADSSIILLKIVITSFVNWLIIIQSASSFRDDLHPFIYIHIHIFNFIETFR